MASSVSSKRAFSSAGITISKRRNCLQGDVVKALQCLKRIIRKDLLLRHLEAMPDDDTNNEEFDLEAGNGGGDDKEKQGHADDCECGCCWSWDALIEELEADENSDTEL